MDAMARSTQLEQVKQLVQEIFLPLEAIPTSAEVVLIARVSSSKQSKGLPSQIALNVQKISQTHSVIGVQSLVMNGADSQLVKKLVEVRNKYQTPYLIAEHYDRFVRHYLFGKERKANLHLLPTPFQLKLVKQACQQHQLTLATIYPNQLEFSELAAIRHKRGKALHGLTLRTYKHQRRSLLIPLAKSMKERGLTYREIAENLYLPLGTVLYWSTLGK